jgi:hypothetical protein
MYAFNVTTGQAAALGVATIPDNCTPSPFESNEALAERGGGEQQQTIEQQYTYTDPEKRKREDDSDNSIATNDRFNVLSAPKRSRREAGGQTILPFDAGSGGFNRWGMSEEQVNQNSSTREREEERTRTRKRERERERERD